MKKQIKAVVLAAGKSTRMKSDYSKLVHKILGKEIINFLLDSLVESGIQESDIILIAGENIDQLKDAVNKDVKYAIQDKQLGTGHALMCAKEHLTGFDGDVLVVAGDNPYITAAELKRLIDHHRQAQPASPCTLLSAVFPSTPPPYGRIIRDESNHVLGVIEEADASEEQKKIREVNASIYMFDNPIVLPALDEIDNNNAKGEYYLTDIIEILKKKGHLIEAYATDDCFISIGINNRWELQEAQERFNRANLKKLATEMGVTVLQPATVTIELGVQIGRDTIIYPSTYIASGTVIGEDCLIGPFAYLNGVAVPDNETVQYEERIAENV